MLSRPSSRSLFAPRGALLDVGILTLTDKLYAAVLRECLAARGCEVSRHALGRLRGRAHAAVIAECALAFRLETDVEKALAAEVLRLFTDREANGLELHPGTEGFLKEIALMPKALLVPGPEDRCDRILKRFDWKTRFRIVRSFGPPDGVLEEPDEHAYARAAKDLRHAFDIPAQACFAFADSRAGADAARKAGLGKVYEVSVHPAGDAAGSPSARELMPSWQESSRTDPVSR